MAKGVRTAEGDVCQVVGQHAPAHKARGIMYSRIQFADETAHAAAVMRRPGQSKARVPRRTAAHMPRNPRQALAAVEARGEKLAALEAVDKAAAGRLRADDAWMRAISRAQGVAVRDDVRLLKKTLAYKERAKDKRGEAWQKRQDDVKADQQARQERRENNIAKRRDAKREKRMAKRR